jgi:hypothetical protein
MLTNQEREEKKRKIKEMFKKRFGEKIDRESIIGSMPKLEGGAKLNYDSVEPVPFEEGRDQSKIVRPIDEKYRSERYQPYDPYKKLLNDSVSVGTTLSGTKVVASSE